MIHTTTRQAIPDDVTCLDDVVALRDMVARVCRRLDVDRIPAEDVSRVHSEFVAAGKQLDGAVVRLARRVHTSKVWQRTGHTSATDYLATTAGITRRQASDVLDTSLRLTGLSATEAAVRDGKLSPEQAAAVADAAQADPDAEGDLLATAASAALPRLRDAARRTKAAADPNPAATAARLHRQRRLRRFTDADGAYHLQLRTTPLAGAAIDAALQPVLDDVFSTARRAARREHVDAYAADALQLLITGTGTDGNTDGDTYGAGAGAAAGGRAPRRRRPRHGPSRAREATVIFHVDLAALHRGHLQRGERCEIAGVGPVPLDTVRSVLPEAFRAVVISDGVDVRHVTHLGRDVTAAQRTALHARGYACEVPGCRSRHLLEIDHITGWTLTRTTRLDDLAWLCHTHHQDKTHHGWHLTGPPGNRSWTHPQHAPRRQWTPPASGAPHPRPPQSDSTDRSSV